MHLKGPFCLVCHPRPSRKKVCSHSYANFIRLLLFGSSNAYAVLCNTKCVLHVIIYKKSTGYCVDAIEVKTSKEEEENKNISARKGFPDN